MCSDFLMKASKLPKLVVLTQKLDFISTFFIYITCHIIYITSFIYISHFDINKVFRSKKAGQLLL